MMSNTTGIKAFVRHTLLSWEVLTGVIAGVVMMVLEYHFDVEYYSKSGQTITLVAYFAIVGMIFYRMLSHPSKK